MFALGNDYHRFSNTYGDAIRLLHHSRSGTDFMLGWWSWTAFYSDITEGNVMVQRTMAGRAPETSGIRLFPPRSRIRLRAREIHHSQCCPVSEGFGDADPQGMQPGFENGILDGSV